MADSTRKEKAGRAGEQLPGLVGILTDVLSQVPNLKRVKKTDTSARAARLGMIQTQAAAVGGAQTGAGASRALALRQGLRGAGDAARGAADAAAQAANQDEIRYQNQKILRNQRLADFGKDAGGMMAQIGQGVVEARNAKRGEADPNAEVPQDPQYTQAPVGPDGMPTNVTRAVQPGAVAPAQAEAIQQSQQPAGSYPGMDNKGVQAQPTPDEMFDPASPNYDPVAHAALEPEDYYAAALGIPKNPYNLIAPELEYKLRVQNLAFQEANRTGENFMRLSARIQRMNGLAPDLTGLFG
jgi:hypothetical protein